MRPAFPRLGFFFAGFTLLLAPGRAQTLAFTVPAGGHDDNGGLDNFCGSLGLLFSLSAPLTVQSLGYWDDGSDGLPVGVTVNVAIFDRNASGGPAIVSGAEISFTNGLGTPVGNIVDDELLSTPPGDPLQGSGRPGQFRLANLNSPVDLPIGNYALVAWGYGNSNEYLNGANTGAVVDVDPIGGTLTFDGSAFGNPPGAFPTTSDGSLAQYSSATFSPDAVSAIPEPAEAALALGASAAAGVWIARRRKNVQA